MLSIFFSLRPKQWIKNFFIFLPLIFGKKLFLFPANLKSALAFVFFSLAASVVYIVNDIIDIEKDKLHPTKCLRPITTGKVSIRQATVIASILGVLSIALSFMLDIYFGCIVVIYFLLNFVYSKILKDLVIIDVFCIGGFFLLRIIAGVVVAGVDLSHWIVIMTILLALFLGFSKRRQELMLLKSEATHHRSVLTKYNLYFIDQIIAVITSSIVIAYMLYTVDARTLGEFGTNHLIFSTPFVYYGIFRYLYLIHKLHVEEDSAHILLFDKAMQINLTLWVIICVAIIYFGF